MINNLDEAIAHAREKAEEQKKKAESNIIETTKEGWIRVYDGKEYNSCLECAKEHEQLVEWLTELQERREADRWIPVTERLPKNVQTVNPNKALKEIIKYMKDDTVTYRDITDDIIIQILKDNGLWEDN